MKTDRKVVLALVAHPDDAEFLCGGTLIRLADSGWQVHFASATAGDCGTMTETPWSIAAIRTREGKTAAESIGGTFHCLGEPDGRLVYDRQSLQKTIDLFRKVAPTLAFALAPKDYHVDHEVASQLARAASFVYAAPNVSEHPLLEGSGVPYLYYCDALEGVDPYGQPVTPTTYVDISEQLERKEQMLSCHASQREWLRAHNGVDEFILSMRREAQARGSDIGVAAAEAFVQHRGHAYPKDDLLAELF